MNFRNGIKILLDLVYPDYLYCICCGKIIDGTRPYRLCNECMEDIRWATDRTCQKCGKPLSEHDPMETCYSCREHSHVFDQGYTCCEYGMNARSILFKLKYNSRTDIGRTIAEVMHDRMEAVRREEGTVYDVITSIPMHADKLQVRGYNQADIIARTLAELEGMPYARNALQRIKNTAPLRGLTPIERMESMRGAIAIDDAESVRGKDVLLIDDIYTTGSTVDAVAEVLRDAGAEYIYVLTFAAGADVVKGE